MREPGLHDVFFAEGGDKASEFFRYVSALKEVGGALC